MEDETTEEISTSESEYSDSFVASDDDDFEDGLNWDSGDSRPAAPSPPSTPGVANVVNAANMSASPAVNIRRRLRPRRRLNRIVYEEEERSQPASDLSVADNSPSPVVSALSGGASDSDETDIDASPYDPTSPAFSPAPRSPAYSPPSTPSDLVARSPSSSPSATPPSLRYIPHSPEYSPSPSLYQGSDTDVEVVEPQIPPPGLPSPLEIQVIEAPEELVVAATAPASENQPAEVVETIQPNSAVEVASSSNHNDGTTLLNSSTLSEGDDSSLCSICMDPLTNSGDHRVVCLKCGHIFGNSCLERWILVGCNGGARRCPTCNKKACIRDIRVLYLPKVVPLDTIERDRLIKEKEQISVEKKRVEMELSRCQLKCELTVKQFEQKISKLEGKYTEALEALNSMDRGKKVTLSSSRGHINVGTGNAKLLHSVEISRDGNCRVLAFSYLTQELVASQPSGNTVFAGFGVRVMNTVDFQPARFVFLHQKPIRDMAFHHEDRDLLLSVSLDTTAKLVDLANATTVHTFKGEGPLWSCCWELDNPHLMLVGSQLGRVRQYDRRMMDHYLNEWETKSNPTPVVALASAPSVGRSPFPQGGFFSCRLKGVYAFSRHGDQYRSQELAIEGSFTSMRYDHTTQSLLTMSRPSAYCPHVKVCLNLVDIDTKANICTPLIHTFNSGSSARVISRVTTLLAPDDTLLAAHHESGRTVNVWSSKTGNLLHSIPVKEPVIDMTSVTLYNNKCLLATLSDSKVNVYTVL